MSDYEAELREYREYNFNDDKMTPEQFDNKEVKCIVLARYHDLELKNLHEES